MLRAGLFVWALMLGVVPTLTSQVPDRAAARAPVQFLAVVTPGAAPVPVEANRVALLRRKISVRFDGATLEHALAELGRQARLKFAYSKDHVPVGQRVTLRAEQMTVAAVLTELLIDAGVDVVVTPDDRLALVRRERRGGGVVVQAGSIVGRVSDAKSGEPLAGAEVFLDGTRWRAVTGQDGRYRMVEVTPGSYTLVARRVGYGRQSRAIAVAEGADVTVEIALQPVATQLNEIVTTVTGDQRRVELGHVVGRINADSLAKEAPVSSLSELLTARVPGVQVFQAQGTVGGEVNVRIRGPNYFDQTGRNILEPVVIIDGVRYTTIPRPTTMFGGPGSKEPSSPLNDLNPNDIESIEVVKGPSAATLYGTDAANGVLVITTKRGRPGPARWNAYAKGTTTTIPQSQYPDVYWGWGTRSNGTPATFSCGLTQLASGFCVRQDSVTVIPNPLNDPELTILGTKPRYDYGINVAGGQQSLRYYLSADFEDATGPVQMPPALAEELRQRQGLQELPREWREPNAVTKLNLRSNGTVVLNQVADLHINTGYVKSATRTLGFTGIRSPFLGSTQARPGSPYGTGALDPAQAFVQTSTDRVDRFLANASGEWRPAPWLATRATLGLDLTSSHRFSLTRPGDAPGEALVANGAVEDTRTRQVASSADLGATATARRGRLSARTAIGAQYVRTLSDVLGSFGQGLPPGGSTVPAAATIQSAQRYEETVLLGGYVEEMLGLNDRMFLTGALRVDGASTFGRDYDAVVYPKAGASWLLSEEPFFPRIPGLEELRLRYAFGASGQQPNPSSGRPSFSPSQLDLNGQRVSLVVNNGLGNPNIRPQRVREHEFGFDASALARRLELEVTWFRRRTADMIVNVPLPPGQLSMSTNLGLVTQRGFEVALTAQVLETRPVSWRITLQHADHATTLADIGGGSPRYDIRGGWVEGYPLGARFERPVIGWNDINGDGFLAFAELQQSDTAVYLGQSTPPREQTLSTVLGLFEGRLRLSALFDRRAGFTQINGARCQLSSCRAGVELSTSLAEQAENWNRSIVPTEKGDFIRLREVTVAVDLPSTLTRALRLSRATLAASGRNLALWTAFSGPDPESARFGEFGLQTVAEGVPQSRGFSLRLDLGL